MLRVATNVVGDDGKRAIGTFIPATAANGVVTLHVSLASDLAVGDQFIFMLALRAGTLVGAYRPYLLKVIAPADGDAEPEIEAEAETEAVRKQHHQQLSEHVRTV